MWVHLLYLQGHEAGEDGVAGILGGSRQDAEVLLFLMDGEELAQQRLDGLPLVVAEVVDDAQQHFLALVKQREDAVLHDVR